MAMSDAERRERDRNRKRQERSPFGTVSVRLQSWGFYNWRLKHAEHRAELKWKADQLRADIAAMTWNGHSLLTDAERAEISEGPKRQRCLKFGGKARNSV